MRPRKKRAAKRRGPVWKLYLYIANTTPRSVLAMENVKSLCEQYLRGHYRLKIIDIFIDQTSARQEDILATPTLVRSSPEPRKILVGSLSETERVLRALELSDEPEKVRSLLSRSTSKVGSA